VSATGRQHDLRLLLDDVESFMDLHGISLNASKTVLARKASAVPTTDLLIAGRPAGTILDHGEPFRVLGVFLSTHCSRDQQIAEITRMSHQLAQILKPKLMTDKIVRYVFAKVVLAKLQYLATGQCLTDAEINQIEMPWRKLMKNKCGLPSSTSTSLLHSDIGYRIPRLADILDQKDHADFQVWMNSDNLVGACTRAHFRLIQESFTTQHSQVVHQCMNLHVSEDHPSTCTSLADYLPEA
jgi:hypothetical protein